ncbi:MAG TPA: formate dehydrogenase [Bacteroidetes bacterium]|nr:formate dehydrogenase [Bacteroidota bacterium]
MSENLSHLSARKGLQDNLFENLVHSAQENGSPENEEMRKLAQKYLMGDAIVYGTASFYDFLRRENRGKKVYVCNGSACMLAGTQEAVRSELKKHFREEEIGEMCCLGRCHENSAFHYNGHNYSGNAAKTLDSILSNGGPPRTDAYNVASNMAAPILTAPIPDQKTYFTLLTRAVKNGHEAVLQELRVSGLRGRGGAGFPLATKLEFCKNAGEGQKYIVCNADEGDPGAYSDRYLLEHRPEAVLLGMAIAGYVTGADTGVVYIRAEYPEAIAKVADTVQKLQDAGLLSHGDFSFSFKVIEAAGAYICGEETALLNSIEGQRPEVRVRPPYPAQQGLFGRPTVVNNVETLASIPWILEHGGAAYAALGRGTSTGSKLVCLDGHFNKPGLYEVEMGTPLQEVVHELGGGFRTRVKALHIGGPLGGIVPVSKIPELSVDFESFAENGFLLGHASVISIPETFPMIDYLEHLFAFTAHESCGKCFPCRLGSTRGQELLAGAISGTHKIDRKLFDDLLETMEIGSLCALGGGLPLGIKNALQYFADELQDYFAA